MKDGEIQESGELLETWRFKPNLESKVRIGKLFSQLTHVCDHSGELFSRLTLHNL